MDFDWSEHVNVQNTKVHFVSTAGILVLESVSDRAFTSLWYGQTVFPSRGDENKVYQA